MTIRRIAALALCFALCLNVALAEDCVLKIPDSVTDIGDEAFKDVKLIERIELPEGLKTIGKYAFMNMPDTFRLTIPDGVTSIGQGAFMNMSNLEQITIPDSVVSIGDDILDGTKDALLIRCAPGSAAHQYALANQHDYNADTVYRALVIGCTYPDAKGYIDRGDGNRLFINKTLPGCQNDMTGMKMALENLPATQYQVTTALNPKANEFDGLIADTFGEATDEDVSIFYYSGHGSKDSELLGGEYTGGIDKTIDETCYYSFSQLRNKLDEIKGRKIVICDSCYSGTMVSIGRSVSDRGIDDEITAEEMKRNNSAFISAFMPKYATRGAFNPSEYFVITASAADQVSMGTRLYSIMTLYFLKGIGWDESMAMAHDMLYADEDADMAVSIEEAYQYTAREVSDLMASRDIEQDVQVYPTKCLWFAPFRQS